MLRPQTILLYFYKLLLWPIFYWFLSWPTNNIIFLFTNNHSLHQQFMKVFVKKFVFLAFCQKWRIKKRKEKKTNSIIMRPEFRQFNFFFFFFCNIIAEIPFSLSHICHIISLSSLLLFLKILALVLPNFASLLISPNKFKQY